MHKKKTPLKKKFKKTDFSYIVTLNNILSGKYLPYVWGIKSTISPSRFAGSATEWCKRQTANFIYGENKTQSRYIINQAVEKIDKQEEIHTKR